jgi:hypothetical protein
MTDARARLLAGIPVAERRTDVQVQVQVHVQVHVPGGDDERQDPGAV